MSFLRGNTGGGFGSTGGTAFGAPAGGGTFGQPAQTGGFGQQQQNTGGFGAPANTGFGATSTGGAFGQQQQNTGSSGLFGSSNTTAGGFGSTGGFGQPKPAFGQSNTSTGGSLFGQPQQQQQQPQQTSAFGGASNTGFGATNTNTLGAGGIGGGFGQQQQQTGGFGQSNIGFGAGGGVQGGANGTGGLRQPFTYKTINTDKTTENFQSITFDPSINHTKNFAELRLEDYMAGRKVGTAAGAQTGGGGLFGSSTSNPAGGGLFGGQQQQQQQQPGGLFGSSNPTGGAFGAAQQTTSGAFGASSTTGGGLFGQNQQNKPFGASTGGFGSTGTTGGGLFGGQTTQQNQAGSGGLFGGSTSGTTGAFGQTTGGAFGSTNTGGAFGQTNPAGGNTSLFGGNQQQQQQQTGGLFGGNQQNKPGGLFGGTSGTFGQTGQQNTTSGGLFGSSNTGAGGTSLFGNTGQQQQQGATGGAFGQQNTASGGLFGSTTTQPQQQQQQGGALFGGTAANQQQPGGLFGNQSRPGTAGSTGGGLFGSNTTGQQQQSGGLFGSTGTTGAATGGGFSFGTNQQRPSTAPGTGGGLFGNTGTAGGFGTGTTGTAGGGLFGTTGAGQQQQQQAGGGLFGGSTSTTPGAPGGGLFGNTPGQATATTGGGLFGNTGVQQNQQGGGLFGNRPATAGGTSGGFTFGQTGTGGATGGGLFGNTGTQQQGAGGGLFGGTGTAGATSGGGLFGTTGATNTASGGLFGSTSTPGAAGGGLFSTPQAQSGGASGSLLFNTPQAGALGAAQQNQQQQLALMGGNTGGLLSGIRPARMDSNPYGASPSKLVSTATSAPLARQEYTAKVTPQSVPMPRYRVTPSFSGRVRPRTARATPGAIGGTRGLANGTPQRGGDTNGLPGTPSARPGTAGTNLEARTPGGMLGLGGTPGSVIGSAGKYQARENIKQLIISVSGEPALEREMRAGGGRSPGSAGRNGPSPGDRFEDASAQSPPMNGIGGSGSRSNGDVSLAGVAQDGVNGANDLGLGMARGLASKNGTSSAGASAAAAAGESTPLHHGIGGEKSAALKAKSALGSHVSHRSRTGTVDLPKLEREDYSCVPTIRELREQYGVEQLMNLSRFEVHHVGYGSVSFDGPVNVRGLDLDAILHINQSEVVMYPSEEDGGTVPHPPVGSGLNKPAIVTLLNVWPKGADGRLNRDPDEDVQRIFEERKLRPYCERRGIEHVGYRSGEWRFRVEHFSRYGLDDDDEDDADFVRLMAERQRQKQAEGGQQSQQMQETPTSPDEEDFRSPMQTMDDSFFAIQHHRRQLPFASPEASAQEYTNVRRRQFFQSAERSVNEEPAAAIGGAVDRSAFEVQEMSAADEAMVTPFRGGAPQTSMKTPVQNRGQSMPFTPMDTTSAGPRHRLDGQSNLAVAGGVLPRRVPGLSRLGLVVDADQESRDRLRRIFDAPGPAQGVEDSGKALNVVPYKTTAASDLAVALRSSGVAALAMGTFARVVLPPGIASQRVLGTVGVAARTLTLKEGSDAKVSRGTMVEIQGINGSRRCVNNLLLHFLALQRDIAVKSATTTAGPESPYFTYDSNDFDGLVKLLVAAARHRPGDTASPADEENNTTARSEGAAMMEDVDDDEDENENDIAGNDDLDRDDGEELAGMPVELSDGTPNYARRAQSGGYRRMAASVLSLVQALFGTLHDRLLLGGYREDAYRNALSRRQAVSEWLAAECTRRCQHDIRQFGGERGIYFDILMAIVSNDLTLAATMAEENDCPRLAMLIGMAGSGNAQELLQQQLDCWRDQRVWVDGEPQHQNMDPDLQAIFTVLAGRVNQVAAGLDWRRAFGVHLWYSDLTGVNQFIEKAWESYGDMHTGKYQAPIPDYFDGNNTGDSRNSGTDLAFSVLRSYCENSPLSDTDILPVSIAMDANHYALQWHIVTALKLTPLRLAISYDYLCVQYAAQLENDGQWPWACFVLCHMDRAEQRTVAVKGVLTRHCRSFVATNEFGNEDPIAVLDDSDLQAQSFGVPAAWLWEAKAQHALYHGRVLLAAKLFVKAGKALRSHHLVIDRLAVMAIVHGDLGLLRQCNDFLVTLQPGAPTDFGSSSTAAEDALKVDEATWMAGGAVLRAYIDLLTFPDQSLTDCQRSLEMLNASIFGPSAAGGKADYRKAGKVIAAAYANRICSASGDVDARDLHSLLRWADEPLTRTAMAGRMTAALGRSLLYA
eukprot:Clim_evm10s85 gene=Clim_evmTU10s85